GGEGCRAPGDPQEDIPIEKLPLARELRRALELEPAVDLRVVRRKELGTARFLEQAEVLLAVVERRGHAAGLADRGDRDRAPRLAESLARAVARPRRVGQAPAM